MATRYLLYSMCGAVAVIGLTKFMRQSSVGKSLFVWLVAQNDTSYAHRYLTQRTSSDLQQTKHTCDFHLKCKLLDY